MSCAASRHAYMAIASAYCGLWSGGECGGGVVGGATWYGAGAAFWGAGGVTVGAVSRAGAMATALELATVVRGGGAGRGLRRGATGCFATGNLLAVLSGVAWGGTSAGTWATWARAGSGASFRAQGLTHISAPAAPTRTRPATTAAARRRRAPAGVTVMVAVALVLSIVAVSVATPALTAVASPLEDTVTTSGCVEAHVARCPAWVEPLRRFAVTVSWTAPPTAMVTSRGVIVSAATFVVFPAPPRSLGGGLHGVLIRRP